MTKAEVRNQALQLPESERLALAEALWASVENPNVLAESGSLPQWQQELLEERLKESRDDPGRPWKRVRAEIWSIDP